jgi:hypothetical protein
VFAVVGAFLVMVLVHEVVEIACGRMVGGTVTELNLSFMTRGSNLVPPQRPWPIVFTYGSGILAYAACLGATVPLFYMASVHGRWGRDAGRAAVMALVFNVILLVWTGAPVYPLNGGRVVRGLLWLVMGRARSLQVACVLGLVGTVGFVLLAIWSRSIWWGIGAAMIGVQCVRGFQEAKQLAAMARLPRRGDVRCPRCGEHPMEGLSVVCGCGAAVDPFANRGACGVCGRTVVVRQRCPMCLEASGIAEWFGPTGLFEVGMGEGVKEG